MNRKEAMALAVEIVDKWSSSAPVKSNGHTVDGWKAPSLAEKVDAAEKLASFLWDAADDTVRPDEKEQVYTDGTIDA
jgi:hypothetical protein